MLAHRNSAHPVADGPKPSLKISSILAEQGAFSRFRRLQRSPVRVAHSRLMAVFFFFFLRCVTVKSLKISFEEARKVSNNFFSPSAAKTARSHFRNPTSQVLAVERASERPSAKKQAGAFYCRMTRAAKEKKTKK